MNKSEIQRELPYLALLPQPVRADEKTVRMCDTELDAIKVALLMSRKEQKTIAELMGISEAYLSLIKTGGRPLTKRLLPLFCSATGWDVVRQYRAMQAGIRIAEGFNREADRIAQIASYTQRAA